MAGELKLSYATGKTVYCMLLNATGQFANNTSMAFETYVTANVSLYAVSLANLGSASSIYEGNFPTWIPSGVYDIIGKQQLTGTPLETDPTIAVEDGFGWTGTTRVGFSDLSTSGQVGQNTPLKLARGVMVQNFPIYLKSSIDHITPFTSGVVSGQVARDGGAFTALQSGAFTEIGLGWYTLSALTSGDLLANSVKLNFTATQISGLGNSDPLPMAFLMQRTSGF